MNTAEVCPLDLFVYDSQMTSPRKSRAFTVHYPLRGSPTKSYFLPSLELFD